MGTRRKLTRRPPLARWAATFGVTASSFLVACSGTIGPEGDLTVGGTDQGPGQSEQTSTLKPNLVRDAGDGVDVGAGSTGGSGTTEPGKPLADGGTAAPPSGTDAATTAPTNGFPAGWLYTSGNAIMVSSGSGGSQWMGRGVNVDDIFFCGYNNTLYLKGPDTTEETLVTALIKSWKPNFVRISLGMASFQTVSWLSDPAQYATPMTNVINAIGKNPNVYVLVTLRSDASMILGDPGDTEPTGIPSDATTTPSASKYPTGTDAVYVALVDAFAHASFVMFGLTNEAGGTARSNATITAAMNHAVGTIRAEEDKLGVPHHIVSVQGNSYTSDLTAYTAKPSPITHDNVVYELHYYPSNGLTASSYAVSSTLPVIVGEYGGFTTKVTQSAFYADMEAKKISNVAWDFEPFSNCAPDLLNVTSDVTKIQATTWGTSVQSYLTSHSP